MNKTEKYLLLSLIMLFLVLITVLLTSSRTQDKNMTSKQSSKNMNTKQSINKNSKPIRRYLLKPNASTNYVSMANNLAEQIQKQYDKYDMFIIRLDPASGVRVGSMLSYMLENLEKPVVIVPEKGECDKISTVIPEVMLYHKNKLYRCTRLVSNNKGEVTSDVDLDKPGTPLELTGDKFQVKKLDQNKLVPVARLVDRKSLSSIPGLINKSKSKSIILDVRNMGNNQEIIKVLSGMIKTMSTAGITVVVVSDQNNPAMNTYVKHGAVNGSSMTMANLIAKLTYICTYVKEPEIIQQLVTKNLRGDVDE